MPGPSTSNNNNYWKYEYYDDKRGSCFVNVSFSETYQR